MKKPIAPQVNAVAAFNRIFAGVGQPASSMSASNTLDKSILDAVVGQYTKIPRSSGRPTSRS